MPSDGGSSSGRDGSSDGRGGNESSRGGGGSGGGYGLGARNTQAGGTATGLGNTGLGSGNTSARADSSTGGGLSLGSSVGGLRSDSSGGGSIGGNLGAGLRTDATVASASLGAALASVSTKPTRTIGDFFQSAFNVASSLVGIASQTPMGVAGGLLGLKREFDNSGFSLGTMDVNRPSVGFNFGGDSGNSNNLVFRHTSGRGVSGGDVLQAENQGTETNDFSGLVGGRDSVSSESGGDVKTAPENPVLIMGVKGDIMDLIIPIVLFVLFKG